MPLPLERPLTDTSGWRWTVTVDRGRLVLDGGEHGRVEFADPEELRALAPQINRAAIEYDLDRQHAAAKASADRRQRRILAGQPAGVRHRPFVEPDDPPLALDLGLPA